MLKKRLVRVLVALFVLFLLIQLVPYGHGHSNPPVRREPAWDTPRTRELARRACFDCHSNETKWPWYSHVAPISWFVQSDVEEGRAHLNFSEFDREQRHAADAAEEVETGGMPLWTYALMHADARLTDAEKKELAQGLRATFGKEGRGEGGAGDGGGHGGTDGDSGAVDHTDGR